MNKKTTNDLGNVISDSNNGSTTVSSDTSNGELGHTFTYLNSIKTLVVFHKAKCNKSKILSYIEWV